MNASSSDGHEAVVIGAGTPIIESLRGLLFGTPIGDNGPIAVAWWVLISVAGYLWARRLYERVPVRMAQV